MSRKAPAILLALGLVLSASPAANVGGAQEKEGLSFRAVDVFIDPQGKPLAAWQVEVVADGPGGGLIVGVEGGDGPHFKHAPYYDPAALQGGRIIIAAFTTADGPPAAKFRAARLHLAERGGPGRYTARVMAAAAPGGERIGAAVEVSGR